jgi:hypothetical protein
MVAQPVLHLQLGADQDGHVGGHLVEVVLHSEIVGNPGRLLYALTTMAVTIPNIPLSFSAWLRMWQCHAQIPGLSAWMRTV